MGQVAALTAFVPALLTAAGITAVGGYISEKLTTVASLETTYTWQVYDSENEAESFFTGTRNFINDNEGHYGEAYFDGITPNDWETNVMAANFYNSTYSFTSWYVNRWTVASGNTYI